MYFMGMCKFKKKPTSHLKTKQWWPGTAGDKLQELSLLVVREAINYLPEIMDNRMVCCVTTYKKYTRINFIEQKFLVILNKL